MSMNFLGNWPIAHNEKLELLVRIKVNRRQDWKIYCRNTEINLWPHQSVLATTNYEQFPRIDDKRLSTRLVRDWRELRPSVFLRPWGSHEPRSVNVNIDGDFVLSLVEPSSAEYCRWHGAGRNTPHTQTQLFPPVWQWRAPGIIQNAAVPPNGQRRTDFIEKKISLKFELIYFYLHQ